MSHKKNLFFLYKNLIVESVQTNLELQSIRLRTDVSNKVYYYG